MSKQKVYDPANLRGFGSNKQSQCGSDCNSEPKCEKGPTLLLQTVDGECELVQITYDDCGEVKAVVTKKIDDVEVKSADGTVSVIETEPGCFDLSVNFPEIPMDVYVTDVIVQSQAGPNGSTVYQFCAVLNNGTKIPYGPVLDTIALVKSSDGSVTVSGPDDNGCFDLSVTPPTPSTLTVNGTIVTHVSGDGTVTTFDFCNCPDVITTLTASPTGIVSYTNEDGVTVAFDICAIVAANCNSTLTVNADGSLTYVDNAGNITNVPPHVHSTLTVSGTIVTHTSGDGTVTSFDFCACPDIVTTMVVTGSIVSYTNEDGVLVSFDICQIIADNCPDTVTTLTLNAAGDEFTYVNEDGVITVVPFCPECVTVTSNDASITVVQSGTNYDISVTDPALQYVPFDPAVHTAGGIVGDGSVANPYQIALPKCDYHSQTTVVFDPNAEPTTPSNPPATKQEGSTLVEKMVGALCYYTCVGGVFTLDYCCPIPEALLLGAGPFDCDFEPTDETGVSGLVTGTQIDAWLDLNLEFSDTALAGITNPCCNTVEGSINSGADQCSGVFQSEDSNALGLHDVIAGGRNIQTDATGKQNHLNGQNHTVTGGFNNLVAGTAADITSANHNVVAGAQNDVVGPGSNSNSVVGSGNTVLAGSANNDVSGGFNTVDIASINNAVTGDANIVGTVKGASSNDVSGTRNTIDCARYNNITGGLNIVDGKGVGAGATYNDISGFSNVIDSEVSGNVVTGGANLVIGATAPRLWSITGGQQNIVGDFTPQGDATTGANNALTVGLENENYGTRTIMGGWANCMHDQDNLVMGVSNEFLNGRRGIMTGWGNTVDIPNRSDYGYTSGLATRKITNFTDVSGFAAGVPIKGAGLSSNRTYEKDFQNGNVTIAGGFTAGFAFPDFGEYAVVDKEIEAGLFVKYTGTHKADISTDDIWDGVSRDEIPVAAGGGIDPENSYWLLDEMGSRIWDEAIPHSEVNTVIDKEAMAKALALESKRVDDLNAKNRADYEAAKNRGDDPSEPVQIEANQPLPIYKEVVTETTIAGYKRNPNYNPKLQAAIKTVGVSMMGRVWVKTSGSVKVGDFLTASKGGLGVVSKDRTAARVLEVKEGMAFVVLKQQDSHLNDFNSLHDFQPAGSRMLCSQ